MTMGAGPALSQIYEMVRLPGVLRPLVGRELSEPEAP